MEFSLIDLGVIYSIVSTLLAMLTGFFTSIISKEKPTYFTAILICAISIVLGCSVYVVDKAFNQRTISAAYVGVAPNHDTKCVDQWFGLDLDRSNDGVKVKIYAFQQNKEDSTEAITLLYSGESVVNSNGKTLVFEYDIDAHDNPEKEGDSNQGFGKLEFDSYQFPKECSGFLFDKNRCRGTKITLYLQKTEKMPYVGFWPFLRKKTFKNLSDSERKRIIIEEYAEMRKSHSRKKSFNDMPELVLPNISNDSQKGSTTDGKLESVNESNMFGT